MLGTGFFDTNNYDKVRSSYSPLVVEEVRKLFSEKKQLRIAEVGAGSGNFTDVIINAGLDIKELYIIEPDENGIEIHKKKFLEKTTYPLFYKNKTSDSTGLEDHSVDIIFVAQAFHWFNIEATKNEFRRILNLQGKIFILGRFLDQEDSISAEYISLTRWGKRKNGFTNNIEAYSKEIMTSFFDHSVEKHNICAEIEMHSLNRLQDEIDIRINSSGDEELKKNKNLREEIHNSMNDFYIKNRNTEGFVPLTFNTFYFCL